MLTLVTFYWYTDSLPRSLYPYRGIVASGNRNGLLSPVPTSKEKPFGHSVFPSEILVLPESWAKQTYPNLVYYKRNEKVSSIPSPHEYLGSSRMLTCLGWTLCGIGTARTFPCKH